MLISTKPLRILVLLATSWGLALLMFLADTNLSRPDTLQESDYIMTFYVAGHLAATGQEDSLYPPPDARSFAGAPFDKAAHSLLPHLPKATTAVYMYTPLVAWMFAPFSSLSPNLSLLLWQILSLAALGCCCYILSRMAATNFPDAFALTSLYGPVLITLWAGQLGIGLGLLPLCLGYGLLLRGYPLSAGAIWSLLMLKPQYFPPALLVASALAIGRNFKPALGLLIGSAAFLVTTALIFSPDLTIQWLWSHKMSDATYSSGLYGIPTHLVTGLPANLMLLFPTSMRPIVKLPIYLAIGVLWFIGFLYCIRLSRTNMSDQSKISLMLIIGLFLDSIGLPHLLYYDLCVLLPVGILAMAKNGPIPREAALTPIAMIGFISISGYLVLFLTVRSHVALPLLLEFILLGLFASVLFRVHRLSVGASSSASFSARQGPR